MSVIERWHLVGAVTRGPAGAAGESIAGRRTEPGCGGGDTVAPVAAMGPVRPAPLQDLIAG